jgi:tRNA C32,U32 (ribose-2'-O)-methylase TrmJ
VLGSARRCATLEEALSCYDLVFCTSGRRGVSGVISPRVAAERAVEQAARGGSIAVVFGNEKTGLSSEELALGMQPVKIPMAADQPSINLAQATQIIAYEWFVAGLKARQQGAAP